VTADDGVIEADLVVIGVGIVPDADLAKTAGLTVENGIVVDEFARTSDPRIWAAGDVANALNPALDRRVRLESWQNAQNQAIAAAKGMAGKPVPYGEIPWFWSDQYDLNLQMIGLPESWDALVVRGTMGQGPFTAYYMKAGVVVGANAVNNAKEIRFARKWIAEKRRVEPGKLADPAIPLKQIDAA
jgi:NADPH-dependent 2,4-dienoyl-CoA reductase/sulfur reductase-like enzyme